jgi:hypothetical protein
MPLTLENRLSLGAIDAVIARAPVIFGRPCETFILAEGPELLEPELLRSFGAKFDAVFDRVRGDGISRFALLRYHAAETHITTGTSTPAR